MKKLVGASVIALIALPAWAQTPPAADAERSLTTPAGHEITLSAGHYTYVEPPPVDISIHGFKIGGGYTGTFSLNQRRHWFAQADLQGSVGRVDYDGFCRPWLITPNSASPNGWALDLGDSSPCSESGDADWYVDARAFVGKDVVGRKWAWSPAAGVGVRHLSNGTTGIPGFRIDDYLYVPFSLTARTRVGSRGLLSLTVEYDHLLRGRQETRNSALGSGTVPATPVAPAFRIDGFTDISFDQHSGWALRASATYQVTKRWSVKPYYIYWRVDSSPPSAETVTFTVNTITARQQLGFYEPLNTTREFGVKLGIRF